jgi:hypothetical protein
MKGICLPALRCSVDLKFCRRSGRQVGAKDRARPVLGLRVVVLSRVAVIAFASEGNRHALSTRRKRAILGAFDLFAERVKAGFKRCSADAKPRAD